MERAGRAIALMGVALPLLLIGHSKFAAFEVEALKPLIGGTPWLGRMYAVSSPVVVSRVLGVIEIATAFLLLASPSLPRAGLAGGALGVLTALQVSLDGFIRIVRDLEDIRGMKGAPGGDMHAVGGATLVSSLMNAGLVDEIRLWRHRDSRHSRRTAARPVDRRQRGRLAASAREACGAC